MRSTLIPLLLLPTITLPVRAQTAGVEFFERKIRPILVEHCYECHSSGAKKIRGQLLLDSRDGVKKGGINGPVIVPGDPDNSPLIRAVRYTDDATKMPKKGKLPAALIADLEAWVKMGAPDPRDKAASAPAPNSWVEIVQERKKWWSLQPVQQPNPPTPRNAAWSSDPIDRFLLANMDSKALTPAADADARTLVRRLSLVLTGLPPTIAEVEEFTRAWDAAGAKRGIVLETLIDRLLASPHFGERWARHWMDVVRFTETHGNEWNYDVHYAWRYRDYLIRAFNDDVSFDRLVREHIAGDLISPRWNKNEKFNEAVLGTAFYRFGEVNHDDCIGLPSIGYDLADNQIDTLSKAFQAMTIACARCHDHKLDAISTRDYHAVLGILRSSRQVAHTIDAPEVIADTVRKMRELKALIRIELAKDWLQHIDPDRVAEVLARKDNKNAYESPVTFARRLIAAKSDDPAFSNLWNKAASEYQKELDERTKHNAQFTMLADFRKGAWPDWQIDGLGLRGRPSAAGEFTIASKDRAVAAILPAGAFTHAVSEKLNGALRSGMLDGSKKFISFQVFGDRAAAVRLVSNNCQLNYRNFKYLTRDELHWVTFGIPAEADALRVYAELMTKFDNPKFPDQLGSLGGGKDYRMPWDKAAADPRSHFGVTHVVLHDQPAPPKMPLDHLRGIIDGKAPANWQAFMQLLAERLRDAVNAWHKDVATDEDVVWLNAFMQAGLWRNSDGAAPKLGALIADYRKHEDTLSLPRVAPGLADFGSGFEQPIFTRGDCTKPGEHAPRQYVEVLYPHGRSSVGQAGGSGRRELAELIASKDNPLTARVFVNRIWHHLFGAGLVRTVDDFGHVGELPSHPELLDYLADRFVRDGWSTKKLIRSIVLTRAFRLSHTPSERMQEADPENRLLARYPARRMEAEAIRDALLAVSGRLDRSLFGPSVSAFRDKEYADRRLFQGPLDGNGRRSIYLRVTLMEAPKFLEVFSFPGGKVCQGRRDVTNTPAQALAMLNDPFVHDQADVWTKKLLARKNDTIESRVNAMLETALGRPARQVELERFRQFVERAAATQKVENGELPGSQPVWRQAAHAMFNLQEFIMIP